MVFLSTGKSNNFLKVYNMQKNHKSNGVEKRHISIGTLEIGAYAKKLINRTLNNRRLSYGPLTARFENQFANYHDCKYGMFTVSGTSALQIALHALKSLHGWRDGDEVLVPAVTFIAVSNTVLQNNMRPVFVDVNKKTYNIDPSQIEKHISKRTRAIIAVHSFGLPAEMDAILKIAKKHKLKVIEDGCEAVGAVYKGKKVGSMGDIGCFSTYVAHIITTGVGGLAITNNPDYAVKMKSLMNHGRDSIYLSIDDDDKVSKESSKSAFRLIDRRFSFVDVGYSYRLTEMEAALGLEQMRLIKTIIRKRQQNAAYFNQALSGITSALQLPVVPPNFSHTFLGYPILILDPKIDRSKLILHLERHGIETRYLMPLINQPIYKKLFGNLEPKYPVAKYLNAHGFYIGIHQSLTKADLEYVVRVFKLFFK